MDPEAECTRPLIVRRLACAWIRTCRAPFAGACIACTSSSATHQHLMSIAAPVFKVVVPCLMS